MSSFKALQVPKRLGQQLYNRGFTTSTRRLADEVRIVEVGPRDGLQNEKNTVPLRTKIELIQRLAKTGIRDIEAGSFVAPKWVPQVRRQRHEWFILQWCRCYSRLVILTFSCHD